MKKKFMFEVDDDDMYKFKIYCSLNKTTMSNELRKFIKLKIIELNEKE